MMAVSISKTLNETIVVDTDEEKFVVEIPADYEVWAVNIRGDSTFITLKKVVR